MHQVVRGQLQLRVELEEPHEVPGSHAAWPGGEAAASERGWLLEHEPHVAVGAAADSRRKVRHHNAAAFRHRERLRGKGSFKEELLKGVSACSVKRYQCPSVHGLFRVEYHHGFIFTLQDMPVLEVS